MQRDIKTIAIECRYYHRQRVFAMDQRKRADLALGAFLKTQLGWSKDLPASERDIIAERAAELVKIGERVLKQLDKPADKRKPVAGQDSAEFQEWASVIMAAVQVRKPFDVIEADAEKALAGLASEMPVWPWVQAIHGFGAVGLANIVAEAGDLSNYANPGKLWKRMGLAPISKRDATKAGATWRSGGGLTDDDWTRAGYSAKRRSFMWNIGDALIKGNGDGYYRTVYLERKEFEREKAKANGLTVVPSAKLPKDKAKWPSFMTKGHIHRRAQRYMEKRLLRDLWNAWGGRSHEEHGYKDAA